MRFFALPALLSLFVVAACGKPSRQQCDRVANHMIDLFVQRNPPPAAQPGAPAAKLAAAADGARKHYKERGTTKTALVEYCRRSMTKGKADCVLEAKSERALADCSP